jgi:hypothetical protein
MSILVNKKTKVITQGITGNTGSFHTRACKEYGTQMVAGVSPGKGAKSSKVSHFLTRSGKLSMLPPRTPRLFTYHRHSLLMRFWKQLMPILIL